MDDKKEVLTAEQAFMTTVMNRLNFDRCMVEIITSAKQGNSFACFFTEIDPGALDRLMEMGYQLGTFRDPMGQTYQRITWKQ